MKKSIGVLLGCCVLLSACSETGAGSGIEANQKGFYLTSDYYIIYDADAEGMYDIAKRLQNEIKKTNAVTVKLREDDWDKKPNEIIVGNTSRGNTAEGLRLKDYSVSVSKEQIIIAGGSPSAILSAVEEFSRRYLTEKHCFSSGDGYIYSHNYKYEELYLNGSAIEEYSVVYTDDQVSYSIADALTESIAENYGRMVRLQSEEDANESKKIVIGNENNALKPTFSDCDYMLFSDSENIYLSASKEALAGTDAGEYFLKLFSRDAVNKKLDVEIPREAVLTEGKTYSMRFISVRRIREIADKVNGYELVYNNVEGKNVVVYAVEVKADSGCQIAAGSVNDGYESGKGLCQTVYDMAKSAEKNGKNVLCAINSGFFDINGSKMPEGILIKDGQVLCKGTGTYDREWWGLTKENTLIFGNYLDLFTNGQITGKFREDLIQAAAGNHFLWRNGEEVEIRDNDIGLVNSRHPRSCFIQRKNGDIVLWVADGRTEFSAGLTMEEEKEIAFRLGGDTALNLDGGGSSQLVAKDGRNGKLSLLNLPLGEDENAKHRKVADSILILGGR